MPLYKESRTNRLWPWIGFALLLHLGVYFALDSRDLESDGTRLDFAPVEIRIVSTHRSRSIEAKPLPIAPSGVAPEPEPSIDETIEPMPQATSAPRPEDALAETPEAGPRTANEIGASPREDEPEIVDAQRVSTQSNPAVAAAPPALAGDAIEDYISMIRRRVAERKRYPIVARRRGLEGEVLASITIATDGSISKLETSGSAPRILARSAARAVKAASPFPPPPEGRLRIEIPLRFQLTN